MEVELFSSSESLLRPGLEDVICLSFHLDLATPPYNRNSESPPCGWILPTVSYDTFDVVSGRNF